MKNEKDKAQDKEQLRNQQGVNTEDAQTRNQSLNREQREEEYEGGDFEANSDFHEQSDNTKQGRDTGKMKPEKGPHLKDESQGGSGKGIDVD